MGAACMKAQVSLEFLVVFLAFLVFLAAWIPLQLKIAEDAKLAIEAKQLQLALADIKTTAETICVLGKNNAKTIEVNTPQATLEMKNKTISIALKTTPNEQLAFKEETDCLLEQKKIELNNTTKVNALNSNGKIEISKVQ